MHIINKLKWRTALSKMHTENSIHFFFTVRRRESWDNHERVFWLYHDMIHLEVFHETFLFENSLTSELEWLLSHSDSDSTWPNSDSICRSDQKSQLIDQVRITIFEVTWPASQFRSIYILYLALEPHFEPQSEDFH